LAGVGINWRFVNPAAERYRRAAAVVLAVSLGLNLVVFYLQVVNICEFVSVLVAILGVVGILGSGISKVLFGNQFYHSLSMASFVGILRFFLFVELEQLGNRRSKPRDILFMFVGSLFLFYIAVEASANTAREVFVEEPADAPFVHPINQISVCLHAGYIGLSLILLIVAGRSRAVNVRRLIIFGLALVVTNTVTFTTKVYFVVRDVQTFSLTPDQLYFGVHATIAGMAIFFLHSSPEEEEFEKVDDPGEMSGFDLGVIFASDVESEDLFGDEKAE
jgi:hypothetical protein